MSLNKSVKLKFHALLAKTAKIYKFVKKRLFYLLTLVRGHLKIVPSYSAIQIRKSQEIPEFYLNRSSNYKRFCKGRASEPAVEENRVYAVRENKSIIVG